MRPLFFGGRTGAGPASRRFTRLLIIALIAWFAFGAAGAAANQPSMARLFDDRAAPPAGPGPTPRLAAVLARHAAETGDSGPQCRRSLWRKCPLADWKHELGRLRGAAPLDQIKAVNRYVNRVPYIEDQANYGTADYWAEPGEFLARGGDCEDYAIAKYISLRALGLADADMRIVALWDTDRRDFHAVLAVRIGGRALVLDNRTARIRPLDEVENYRPVYSVNEAGWRPYRS